MMEFAMRLDKAGWRFCVTKMMLHALGEPTYIQMGVEQGAIIILKASYGLKVRPTASGVFYITSKKLIREIQKAYPFLEDDCSYRFHGELHDGYIRFPMDTVEKVLPGSEEGRTSDETI